MSGPTFDDKRKNDPVALPSGYRESFKERALLSQAEVAIKEATNTQELAGMDANGRRELRAASATPGAAVTVKMTGAFTKTVETAPESRNTPIEITKQRQKGAEQKLDADVVQRLRERGLAVRSVEPGTITAITTKPMRLGEVVAAAYNLNPKKEPPESLLQAFVKENPSFAGMNARSMIPKGTEVRIPVAVKQAPGEGPAVADRSVERTASSGGGPPLGASHEARGPERVLSRDPITPSTTDRIVPSVNSERASEPNRTREPSVSQEGRDSRRRESGRANTRLRRENIQLRRHLARLQKGGLRKGLFRLLLGKR